MKKTAPTQHPIHSLIAERWSPRAFAAQPIPRAHIQSLLEAARWAPSSYNEQPWRFILATRAQAEPYARILATLNEFNQSWACAADLLIIACSARRFARNGEANRHADHDLGLALQNLSLQATALGLAVHMMAGFDPEKARQSLAVPEGVEPLVALAVGYPGELSSLPEGLRGRETAARERKPLSEIAFEGTWGRSL